MWFVRRGLTANSIDALLSSLPIAQHLHRAILRTGTSIIEKKQIKHLSTFRFCLVKDGPDVALFTHPAALTKLALWLGEAFANEDIHRTGKLGMGGRGTPLVVAGLNEQRGVYVIVGMGGGGSGAGWGDREALKKRKEAREAKMADKAAAKRVKEQIREQKAEAKRQAKIDAEEDEDDELETESESESDSESEDEDDGDDEEGDKGFARNRFGVAFQEVSEETRAKVRVDSFEHSVVEVKKDSLSVFLEGLSMKSVIG